MKTVTIETSRFGLVEVDETLILNFVSPILGFENLTRYVLLDHSPNSPFQWLQSMESPELAFVVTNPKYFGINYEFVLPEEAANLLSITQAEDAMVMTITNIPAENPTQATANLMGPIIVNQTNKHAMQLVLSDTEFSTKTRLIPDSLLHPSGSVTSESGD